MQPNAPKPYEIPLSTVHDAITVGKFLSQKDGPKVNWTFRCSPRKKAMLENLLKVQGVDASKVMQGFVDCLLKDYMGEKAFAKTFSEPEAGEIPA